MSNELLFKIMDLWSTFVAPDRSQIIASNEALADLLEALKAINDSDSGDIDLAIESLSSVIAGSKETVPLARTRIRSVIRSRSSQLSALGKEMFQNAENALNEALSKHDNEDANRLDQ